MELTQIRAAIPGLAGKQHSEKISIFGWWLHVHKGKPVFTPANIGKCYDDLDLARPTSFGGYFQNLLDNRSILKAPGGYKLEHETRAEMDRTYGKAEATVKASAALAGLADRLPDVAERSYFKEAMICHVRNAPRAAVVMAWNIAYAHLCDHILATKLAEFNAQWPLSQPNRFKNKAFAITSMDDFNDLLKESEVMAISRDAKIITKNVWNTMEIGLKRRNAAAHPSTVIIGQEQTDAHILDMIDNVVLAIK